jgi:hypothetical protein
MYEDLREAVASMADISDSEWQMLEKDLRISRFRYIDNLHTFYRQTHTDHRVQAGSCPPAGDRPGSPSTSLDPSRYARTVPDS